MFRKIFALSAALSLPALAAGVPREVTFHKDVVPILQKRCQGCHRPGEIGPMSFLGYQETRPWAKAIREAVLLKKMPPWFADPAHGKFENDRSLAPAEIETLAAWADGGAREGDPKDAPKPLEFVDGWTIGKPDAVIEMPNEFRVPASGTVDYQWVMVPTGFTEDQWVERIEVRPSNRAVVHHVVLFAREPGSPYLKRLQAGVFFPTPDSSKNKRKEDTGAGFFWTAPGTEIVSVYVPGGVAYQLKPGQARLIKAGSDLLFEVHYTANGKAGVDRMRVGMVFAKEPPKQRVKNMLILNTNLRIPPGAADHAVHARVTLGEGAEVLSLFPHMHFRGKAFEYRAVYPTGESEVLLDVPKYNFNWQLTYYLDKARPLPKGTQLECIARYDNSPNNPANPDPSAEVIWGDQTWEEMLAGFLDVAFDVGMDPSKLIVGPRGTVRGGD